MERLHIDLLCRSSALAETDAVRDHTLLLQGALAKRATTTARAHDLRRLGDTRDLCAVLHRWPDPAAGTRHVVLVQYNPNSFARYGAAWWLPGAIRTLRRRASRVQVVLLVHELWSPLDSMRNTVLGIPQRIIFALLHAGCDLVAASTESIAVRASPWRRAIGVLPVGSNLPDARASRLAMRRCFGIRDHQRVVAAFGTGHPSRLFTHLRRAIEVVTARDPGVVVLNLGAGAPPLDGLAVPRRILTPGRIGANELARYISMVDLLLLPFSDGVATRRTTVMAGLQHGVPILGTDGTNTSAELRSSRALALAEATASPQVYAERACELLDNESERRRLGRAGRALYEERFAWPVIAGQLVTMIQRAPERAA